LETVKEIGDIIKQVNTIEVEHNISERYQHPDETLLDSMVLSSASNVLVKCIESVDVNTSTYVSSEFADRIISFCKDGQFEAESLIKLLSDAQHIVPQVPEYNYVYGTYDLQNLPKPKQRKERQKQGKEKFERKEPEKVTNLEKVEKGIDEIVKVLYDVLTEYYEKNNEEPIKYYDYVIDTSSFSNTVENMFYCSFLVRDGRAHIDLGKVNTFFVVYFYILFLDRKGEPYIKPIKKRQLKAFREEGGVNSQIISVITIPEWEMFKKEGYLQKYKNKSKQ
jgi:hypothetical protein